METKDLREVVDNETYKSLKLKELELREKTLYFLSIGIGIPMNINAVYLFIKHIRGGLLFYTFLVLAILFVVVTIKLFFVFGQEDKLKGDGKDGI